MYALKWVNKNYSFRLLVESCSKYMRQYMTQAVFRISNVIMRSCDIHVHVDIVALDV